MNGIPMLILSVGGIIAVLFFVTYASQKHDLNGIKDKTVGNGQHGTARWATRQEIKRIYHHVPFTPEEWRQAAKNGNQPTANGKPLPQGIVLGCQGGRKTTALVDSDDVHVLMIGASGVGKTAYANMKEKFEAIYTGSDSTIQCEQFGGQCTEAEILRCTDVAKDLTPDVVVGIGGGKTMDTAKAVADNYNAFTVIVPTTASTDAPAMGLSVVYTAEGEHIGARHYKKNPDLVLLDTDIIAKAPVRFLVAGIGDALATYPECRANKQSASPNYVNSGFHQTIAGMAVSKACHETILSKGISAKLAAEKGLVTKDVEDVIEANTLLSGLGVQNTSCAGAHSIAEGITVLPPCARLLHGEVVTFGILVQLIVEGAPASEIDEMFDFFNHVGLPTTFADLGIADATDEDIMKVAEASMHSYWDVEPFAVNPQMVFDGIKMANIQGMMKK